MNREDVERWLSDVDGLRTVSPTSGGNFSCAEVAAMFTAGLLRVSYRRTVRDGGLLAAPLRDEWDKHVCPNCRLRWPEVVFCLADYACRCGYVFIGFVEDFAGGTAENLWSAFVAAAISRFPDGLPDEYEDDDSPEREAIYAAADVREERIGTTRRLLGEDRVQLYSVRAKIQRHRRKRSTAVWLPEEVLF